MSVFCYYIFCVNVKKCILLNLHPHFLFNQLFMELSPSLPPLSESVIPNRVSGSGLHHECVRLCQSSYPMCSYLSGPKWLAPFLLLEVCSFLNSINSAFSSHILPILVRIISLLFMQSSSTACVSLTYLSRTLSTYRLTLCKGNSFVFRCQGKEPLRGWINFSFTITQDFFEK